MTQPQAALFAIRIASTQFEQAMSLWSDFTA